MTVSAGRSRRRGLAFAVAPPLLAAAIGSLGARSAPEVYARLEKPRWAPPAAAYGPVWTALYATIGVAGWRLWSRDAPAGLLRLHVGQLALNAAWPLAFFSVRDKRLSLAVIAALDFAVAAEVVAVARRDRKTAALLAPYLLWSLFATALNATVEDPGQRP